MDASDHYLKQELYERICADGAFFGVLDAGTSDGLWFWDLENPEHEWLSPRFWRLLGYDPASKEHLASEWQAIIHPDDLLLTKDNFGKHCADPDHPYDQIGRYRHKEGWTVWVRRRGSAIRDASGKPIRMLGTHTDVTELKRTEERHNRFFALSLDLHCIASSDGYFKSVSPGGTHMLGWTGEEFLARPFLAFVHPDDHAATLREVDRQMVAGKNVLQFENRYQHKDGSWRVLSWRSVPAAGGLMYATARDVTERRNADRRFRDLLESAPDAMVIVDRNGKIVLINSRTEELFGYSRSELLEKEVEMLLPERYRDRHLAHRTGFVANPRVRPMGAGLSLYGRRKDGSNFSVEVSLSPLQTDEGTLVSSVIRDVTEQVRLQAALVQAKDAAEAANRELESFSYSVAHDLRAPLRSIDGFSQALLEDYGGKLEAQGEKYLRAIGQSAQHMAQLIDDILALAKVSRDELHREDVDLSALAHATVQRLKRDQPDRRVDVVIQNGLRDEGDTRLLAVVFNNLLGNAWKFTRKRDGARIDFGVGPVESGRAYFVRDNGAGFDPAYANKLFGVFQRLHKDSEFEGTGVGLATVQRIISRHGGRVWAEGRVNAGATIYFTLNDREAPHE